MPGDEVLFHFLQEEYEHSNVVDTAQSKLGGIIDTAELLAVFSHALGCVSTIDGHCGYFRLQPD
jgi:hypothetical protein